MSLGFVDGPFPVKLYSGPLSKFNFSGLYVPGAKNSLTMRISKKKITDINY